MAIRFQCGQCGAGFKAGESQAGQDLPCPKCGAALQVPPAGRSLAEAQLAPPDDPLDETESAGFGDTQIGPPPANPFVGLGKNAPPLGDVAPPPPPPPAAANAYQSPQAPLGRPRDLDLADVRITDIKLPFWSVARLIFQVWLVAMVLGAVAWVLMAIVLLAFTLLFGGAMFNLDANFGP